MPSESDSAAGLVRNALTVDLEDYYHSAALGVPREEWDRLPSRVVGNVNRLLELLDEHRARATFFVTGWLADRYPLVVKRLAADGHEIACHGYWHTAVTEQTPEQFRTEVRLAGEAIAAATGSCLRGFRAPHYSIPDARHWAFQILAEEGFEYDSSLVTAQGQQGAASGAEGAAFVLPRGLVEFPPAAWRRPGLDAAGPSLRLLPSAWIKRAVRRLNGRGVPVVAAVRLWELDPDQPRLPCGLWARWRHYHGLADTERKLRELLDCGRFGRVDELPGVRGSQEGARSKGGSVAV